MKKLSLYMMFFLLLLLSSCEEIIDVNLDTAPPKLVIEASIHWEKGTIGNLQVVKLSTTTDYFSDQIPVVSGAEVHIETDKGYKFPFYESGKSGKYLCNSFIPMMDHTYTLIVKVNGNTYTATETLKSVAEITRIEQNDEGGIFGDKIEVKGFFNDPESEENFYLFKYSYSNKTRSTINVSEDKFYNGNEFYSSSDDDDLKAGDTITISQSGISRRYFNYMSILVSLAGTSGGGAPFQSPPATVRGNIINTTEPENYPLGYFSLSATQTLNYIVK